MRTLNSLREAILQRKVALWIIIVLLAMVVGSKIGSTQIEKRMIQESSVISSRNQKILEIIVKRNPQATIREFVDFPNKLVEGSAQLGLDFRYVMALIDKESEWKPGAVSYAGAIGLTQLMPETAMSTVKKMGLEGYEPPVPNRASVKYTSLGSLSDPVWNLKIGMQYLRWQIDEYGFGPQHLRAYNRGGSKALAHWPQDRYAEDIAFKFVSLAHALPSK